MPTRWFLLISLAACGFSDSDPEEGPPILDRAPRVSHECSITREAETVAESRFQLGSALARTGSRYVAAYGAVDPDSFEPRIALSELRFDPVELAPPHLQVPAAGYATLPSLIVRDGTLGLSWVADAATGEGVELHFALLDDAGELVAGPVTLHGADGDVEIRIHAQVATADGFRILWSDAWTSDAALYSVALDESGAPAGDRVTIRSGPVRSAHLIRRGDGFAAVWTEESGVHLALLDERGASRTEPAVLVGPGRDGRIQTDPFVAAIGDELVVAWTERSSSSDYEDPKGGHALIRLARVSGDGQPLGPVERLQAVEDGIVSALSSLLPMDGALAIAWSRETYIAICGGCISDATIRVVMLDPVDLVPVSEVVELVGPSGLKSAPMVGSEDGGVAFLLTVDYHALADLAAALIRCARAEAAPAPTVGRPGRTQRSRRHSGGRHCEELGACSSR